MADRVQKQLEDVAPELQLLVSLNIFDKNEVKNIVENYRKYEFDILSNNPHHSLNAFKQYLIYNIQLDKELQTRCKGKPMSVRSSPRRVPLRLLVRRRIHSIFRRCMRRFISEIPLWHMYCEYCYSMKSHRVMDRVIVEALSLNPGIESLWKLSAAYTLRNRGVAAARNVIQRGIRVNPTSLVLYVFLFELEVKSSHDQYINFKGRSDIKISILTWKTIFDYSLKCLNGEDVTKFVFFTLSLFSRLHREREFINSIDGYDNFVQRVMTDVFDRRTEFPILGLYIWQHRLLESLTIRNNGREIFNEFVNDSIEVPGMIPYTIRFINNVLSYSMEDTTSTEQYKNENLFNIDIIGEEGGGQMDNKGPDSQSEDLFNLLVNQICLLKEPSSDFDGECNNCPFTRNLISKKQLILLHKTFNRFFTSLVQELNRNNEILEIYTLHADIQRSNCSEPSLTPGGNTSQRSVIDAAGNSDTTSRNIGDRKPKESANISEESEPSTREVDLYSTLSPLLRLLALVPLDSSTLFHQLRLASKLNGLGIRLDGLIKKRLKSMGGMSLTGDLVVLLLEEDSIDILTKIEMLKGQRDLKLTDEQLLESVDVLLSKSNDHVPLTIMLLLGYSSASITDVIISEDQRQIFNKVMNKLKEYRKDSIDKIYEFVTNDLFMKSGLNFVIPNHSTLNVLISRWLVDQLIDDIKQPHNDDIIQKFNKIIALNEHIIKKIQGHDHNVKKYFWDLYANATKVIEDLNLKHNLKYNAKHDSILARGNLNT